jgi:predicted nucleic acid-binding protein
MEQGYLIDTNVAIYFLEGRLPTMALQTLANVLTNKPQISVVTRIELLSWNDEVGEIKNFVSDCLIFALSEDVVDSCIFLRRKYKMKLPDAVIAATAIVKNLQLITRNESDFKKVKELSLLNPFR